MHLFQLFHVRYKVTYNINTEIHYFQMKKSGYLTDCFCNTQQISIRTNKSQALIKYNIQNIGINTTIF